jgi:hypothetical protein
VHAPELVRGCVVEFEVGEFLPEGNGPVTHQRLFDPTEPAKEAGRVVARNPIRQKEIQSLVLTDLSQYGFICH